MEFSETNADCSKRLRWLFVRRKELRGMNLSIPFEFVSNNYIGEK